MSTRMIAGIDIGGTKCASILGAVDAQNQLEVLGKTVVSTADYPDPYQMIGKLQEELEALLNVRSISMHSLEAIGISCGGPLDSKEGVILSPPNLPGWDEIPIVRLFNERFHIPTFVQNDANACALAEWLMGAGRGTSNMIFLTFGTGMGAGLILNGKLYSGTNDLGGEVGHIRLAPEGPVGFGKAGSFEGFCSGGGIAQLAQSIVTRKLENNIPVGFCTSLEEVPQLDAKKVAAAAHAGDPAALEIIRTSAEFLGKGLAVLIDILNPECIVIGSIFARNEELFKPFAEKIIREEAIPGAVEKCTLKPAELGESVGDFAALGVAVNGRNLD